MSRKFLAAIAVVLSLLGCNRQQPAAAPVGEPASTPKVEIPAAPPAAVTISKTAPAESAAPAALSGLRELTSRYLESDGKGGWRKDEKVATELEKLTAEEVAQLWPLFKDQQVNIRRAAAVFLLGIFDYAHSDQVEAFTALLSDSDTMVRARGLDAAKQFAAADQIALQQLAALVDSRREERPENRAAAARLCGSLKRDAEPSLPALKQAAANDPDAKVRAAALAAVAQVAEPLEVVNTLASGLADKDASVRLVAAARLRQFGPAAAPAAMQLAGALADSSKDVAEAVAESLIRIGPPSVEPLADQLSSTNMTARKLSLACLAKLGPVAKPVIARIEKCKQDRDAEVRQLAEAALKRISPQ